MSASALPVKGPTGEVGSTSSIITGLPGWNNFIDDAELNTALQWPGSVNAFERMRNDSQIDGLLRGTMLPLKRRCWALDPNGANPKLVEEMQVDLGLPLLGEDGYTVPESSNEVDWDETLHHLLLALVFGFMAFEIVGGFRDDDSLRWRLDKLAPRMPRSINSISVHPNGDLMEIKQIVGWNTPPIKAHRLLWAAFQKEGGNWVGRSLLRPLYANWLIKDRLIRIDAMAHERAGVPTPVAKPEKTLDPTNAQMTAMYEAAAAVKAGEATGLALPPGWDLDFKGGTGKTGAIGSVEYHDQVMARALMMGFTSLGQGTASGSRALSNDLTDFFTLGQDAVAEWACKRLNAGLLRKWTTWTEGADAPSPRIVSYRESGDVPTSDLVAMVERGLITVDAELEKHLRQKSNLPAKPTETDDAPAGQSYAYDLEGGTITVDERRSQLGLEPHPSGLGHLTLPEMQRELGISTDGTSNDAADVAAAARMKQGRRRKPPRESFVRRVARAARLIRGEAIDPAKLPERQLRRKPYEHEIASCTDFRALEANHADETDKLFSTWWDGPRNELVDDLIDQIEDAGDDVVALASVSASETYGTTEILDSMTDIAVAGADEAVKEAAEQGVKIAAPSRAELREALAARAEATAVILNGQVAESAARAAVRTMNAEDVRAHLTGTSPGALTGAFERKQLGGGLWQSQETGRREVMVKKAGSYYASELLDTNTCGTCVDVDGTEYDTLEEAEADYPTGGYSECEGGDACRGTLVKVYSDEGSDVEDDE